MSLSILNNVAALYAQNNLNSTQAKLQTTLQQLSSGTRINSGADDPSGLAVSDGLTANQAALSQSATNATEGIGMLQTADGALSQVTSLLDQAVTIATEIGGGTLTSSQIGSANQEYTNILAQITNIGTHTNYNSKQVFTASAVDINVTDGTQSGTNSYSDIIGELNTSSIGTTAPASGSSSALNATVASNVVTFTPSAGTNTLGGTLSITGTGGTTPFTFATSVTAGTSISGEAQTLNGTAGFSSLNLHAIVDSSTGALVITDSSLGGNTLASASNLTQTPAPSNAPGAGEDLSTSYSSISTSNSTAAAQAITDAIGNIAYQRGTLGADINELSSAASVASAEQVNLTSAQNSISATDYGQAASNLSKYQILSQTGISALAQANSVQQEVLKLLQ